MERFKNERVASTGLEDHAQRSQRSRMAHADHQPTHKRHILTVTLEDYYHTGTFNSLIERERWSRFESRLVESTAKTLELLGEFDIRATFFVLGWVADALPELVKQVADRGHEVASKGYYHRSICQMSRSEFHEDLLRARETIERATGRSVGGFRIGHGWFGPADLWALDVLAENGFAYDSSVGPVLRAFAAEPWRRFAHQHQRGECTLWEFPISAASWLGWHVPIAGANYFRQFPHALMKQAVAHWDRTYDAPFVMYFHTWELDSEQPRISAAPLHARIRHYRNLDKMPAMLRYYFGRYQFCGIAEHLGIDLAAAPAPESRAFAPLVVIDPPPVPAPPDGGPDGTREPGVRLAISVVIPCFNEELSLPYLSNTLRSVESALEPDYQVELVFVDDGSTDRTWETLHRLFGAKSNATFLRHTRNRGVTAGIITGIRSASANIVCSIDCDCTYDPHELTHMIPLLTDGVDLVTASPYHPEGQVRNVPAWRLSLSRTLSRLYRALLRQPLHTYTSCFRVYRRDAVLRIEVDRDGFLGVAELLGKLAIAGSVIVEYPATLEVRMLGRSKMKILRTIAGHLGLLVALTARRMLARGGESRGGESRADTRDVRE